MGARHFDVEVAELPLLTPDDMRHFDPESVSLVLEYQTHGWTGRMSSNQHAILRAPDGDGTASISRKYRRKRSAEIMRRPLDQWLRRKQRERAERERSDAFGLPPDDSVKLESAEPPWRLAADQSYDARLRMQKLTRDWWEDTVAAGSGKTVWQLLEDGEDNWMIAAATREEKIVRIVAVGPATDPAQIEQMKAEAERHNQHNNKESLVQEDQGPLTGTEYLCPEPGCDRSFKTHGFKTQGALNLHAQKHDDTELPCPMCPRVLTTAAGFGRHIRSKEHKDDPRLALVLESRGLKPAVAQRECEYGCGRTMPIASIGGHHRRHKQLGHIKIADGGDGATQVLETAKAITAPEPPAEAPQAATAPPVQPVQAAPLVVQAVPAVTEPAAVNGTGHAVMPTDLLNQVRALVNPELVGDLERLRTRNQELETQLEAVTRDRDELQAWKDMMREAMNA